MAEAVLEDLMYHMMKMREAWEAINGVPLRVQIFMNALAWTGGTQQRGPSSLLSDETLILYSLTLSKGFIAPSLEKLKKGVPPLQKRSSSCLATGTKLNLL